AQQISSGAWKSSSKETTAAVPAQSVDFKPGGSWKLLDSTGFSVQYPGNWDATENAGNAATIAPAGGVVNTANGNVTIYGVIIDDYRPQQSTDLATATNQLIASVQQGNPGMKAVTGVQDVLVNKQPGKSMEFVNQGASAGGAAERDWLVTISRNDGSLSYLVFVAPQKDFESLRGTYEQMLRTFRVKQ
ncbi:MAG TPA: hypothetical protein VFA02_09125, partial [Pseudacidobacterium sp.]|nr:hypothetical protein [Pseudacidobacterium sp.]